MSFTIRLQKIIMFVAFAGFGIPQLYAVTKKALPILDEQFVRVKSGCFNMGDLFGDGLPDERPIHKVCLSEFRISKYEVTQEIWLAVMGTNPAKDQSNLQYPIDVVSWWEVEAFLKRLNSFSEKQYRLPTEAEWEYACRAGGKKLKYGTKKGDHQKGISFIAEESSNERGIQPVGSFSPNALGLYDMSSNVSEWVSDWFDISYFQYSPTDNPKGPSTGIHKVRRGGHWGDKPWVHRCTLRNFRKPNFRLIGLGFRLVQED